MEKQQQSFLDLINKDNILESEEVYRSHSAINQSALKQLEEDPSKVNQETTSSDAMNFGSLVDVKLTGTTEDFDKQFVRITYVPRPQMEILCQELIKLTDGGKNTINDEIFKVAYDLVGFKRDKIEKVAEEFREKDVEYFKCLARSKGKILLDFETESRANKIVETLKTHKFTKHYFEKPKEGIEVLFQVPIVFNLPNEEKGKALLDMIIIDHNNKTVEPLDIKTTSDPTSKFKISFMKYKYYIQASFYSFGLQSIIPEDYTMLSFKFIIVSTTKFNDALTYECNSMDLAVGRHGTQYPNSSRMLKGWEPLSQEYCWHRDTGLWDYSKSIYDSKGLVLIDMFSQW